MNTSLFLVDYKGDVCNNEKQYMKDFCVDKAIEKESIKKAGGNIQAIIFQPKGRINCIRIKTTLSAT